MADFQWCQVQGLSVIQIRNCISDGPAFVCSLFSPYRLCTGHVALLWNVATPAGQNCLLYFGYYCTINNTSLSPFKHCVTFCRWEMYLCHQNHDGWMDELLYWSPKGNCGSIVQPFYSHWGQMERTSLVPEQCRMPSTALETQAKVEEVLYNPT